MRGIFCCKLRSLALTIGVVFFLMQTGFLILFLYGMVDIKSHLSTMFDWLISEAKQVEDFKAVNSFQDMKFGVVRRASDFLAIPITIDIVLMISNSLLIWATASKHKILLWPWLVLHALEWLCFLALLIYTLIIIPKAFIKVLLFLVVCPFLIIFAFCWFVIKCFFSYLRDLQLKQDVATIYHVNEQKQRIQPSTVYSTAPESHWDHPLPIWANSSRNQTILDPALVQKLDPRYNNYPYAMNSISAPSPSMSYLSRRSKSRITNPTRLPDGTLVVPISDDPDDLTEIEEEGTDLGSTGTNPRSNNHKVVTVVRGPLSEDGTTSVMSLSDKYRQQDEVEVFEEVFQLPPKPIMPRN